MRDLPFNWHVSVYNFLCVPCIVLIVLFFFFFQVFFVLGYSVLSSVALNEKDTYLLCYSYSQLQQFFHEKEG